MSSEALGYIPLSNRGGNRLGGRTKVLICLAFVAGIICYRTIAYHRAQGLANFGPLSSALDNYQRMFVLHSFCLWVRSSKHLRRTRNPFPMIHEVKSGEIATDQRAVVSSMYTDSYVFPLAVLGHTLKRHRVNARRVLIYLPDRVSNRTLCFVKEAGWELHPVTLIPPPHQGKGIHHTFVDQYTKLTIWTLDKIGIKTAVYLDADTIVRRNFDELWNLPFEFGAVPDIWIGNPGFTAGFNAGILFFHPSTRIFEDMVSKLETTDFRLKDAEQSYLNHYFGAESVRLPYAYGGNLAIKERSPEMWKAMQADMRIVHYTVVKPFDSETKCPDGMCDQTLVYDLKKQEDWLEKAKTKWGGHFAPELTWWEDSFNSVMGEIGNLCPASL